MAGRQSDYTDEIADAICARLSNGESLRSICRDESMPCASTVFLWLRTKDGFSEQYVKAKEESADALVEDMLDIADNASNDWMESHDEDNVGYRLNGEHIQRSKLRVDVRKWAASKLKPKKYGEKIAQEVTGADGGPVKILSARELSDAELLEIASKK